MKSYLDIETSFSGKITIIGVYHERNALIQLVGDDVLKLLILEKKLFP
jgi:hypothetical protein